MSEKGTMNYLNQQFSALMSEHRAFDQLGYKLQSVLPGESPHTPTITVLEGSFLMEKGLGITDLVDKTAAIQMIPDSYRITSPCLLRAEPHTTLSIQ